MVEEVEMDVSVKRGRKDKGKRKHKRGEAEMAIRVVDGGRDVVIKAGRASDAPKALEVTVQCS